MDGFTVIADKDAFDKAKGENNVYEIKEGEEVPTQVEETALNALEFAENKYYTKNAEAETSAAAVEATEMLKHVDPTTMEQFMKTLNSNRAKGSTSTAEEKAAPVPVPVTAAGQSEVEEQPAVQSENIPPATMYNISNEPGVDPPGTADADKKFIYNSKEEVDKARADQELDPLLPTVGGRRRTRRRDKKGDKKSRRQSKKGGKKHRKSAKKGSSKSKKSRRYSRK